MLLFRASFKFLAGSLLSASMLFSSCAAPQNSGEALSESSSSSNEIVSSMSSKEEAIPESSDASVGTNDTNDKTHSTTIQTAVNIILDDIICGYVDPSYTHYYCRESKDFWGYIIDAISYGGTPIPQLCIETEWLQDGYGCSYYMVHFYSREYDKNNHLLNKTTVNRYIVSLPEGKITPMLDKDGNFMKEYNDMIK